MYYYDPETKRVYPVGVVKAVFPVGRCYFEIELKGGHTVKNVMLLDVTVIPNHNPNLFVITTDNVPDEYDVYTEHILEFPIVAWRIERMLSGDFQTMPVIANERLQAEITAPNILDKSTGLITDAAGDWCLPESYADFKKRHVDDVNAQREAERAALYMPWTEDHWSKNFCLMTDIGKPSPVRKDANTTIEAACWSMQDALKDLCSTTDVGKLKPKVDEASRAS